MNQLEFVSAVNAIADSRPVYREGGTGRDGTCDCIGLIMGAMNKSYPMHSTNYFARFQMRVLDSLLDESQLHEGAVVYKSRRSTEQLHERYQPGGRYYTGDMLDYYHVGVVTGINPVQITHCTSTDSIDGIAYDTSISAWSHIGDLLDVQYGDELEEIVYGLAVVHTEDGNPVKLRPTPSTKLPYIAKVPNGAQVTLLESADGWSTVLWNGQRGYMMSEFLSVIGAEMVEQKQDDGVVTITLPRSAARALYEAFMKGGWS